MMSLEIMSSEPVGHTGGSTSDNYPGTSPPCPSLYKSCGLQSGPGREWVEDKSLVPPGVVVAARSLEARPSLPAGKWYGVACFVFCC